MEFIPMKRNFIINCAVLWIALSALLYAQEPDPQSYDVAVTTITVWVKAVDGDGKPVEGLTQADFEVFEDKKKVDTNCFEEVKQPEIAVTPDASKPAAEQ